MSYITADIPWIEPIELAEAVAALPGDMAFLHSSLKTGYSGKYSLLAWDAETTFQGDDFTALPSASAKPVFGYFAYELGNTLEPMPRADDSYVSLPKLHLVLFRNVLRFEHEHKTIEAWDNVPVLPEAVAAHDLPAPQCDALQSNMSRDVYLSHAQDALDSIGAGNFYQVNLTRKFYGTFSAPVSSFDLYRRLIHASAAPYSAFLQLGDASILSSSPELFLKIENGHITSRPIKGTSPRGISPESDTRQKAALGNSTKDQAENLMIVDLMRHDLARVCLPGSVKADELFAIDSFPTVHHLSSSLSGTLLPGKTPVDALMAAFPPGSMTGAPKIAAMEWLAKKEAMNRGVYSGALGWFTEDEAEWSVVIRTLLIKGRKFEFQVGGGIVADSTPEAEWQETIYKAEGILRGLGLDADAIKAI